jgi:hypothetical protein
MPTLLVSGPGLGDTSVFGSIGAATAAPTIYTSGADYAGLGVPRVSPEALGRNVAFNFVVVKLQPATCVRLDFDTTRPFTPRSWDSAAFGATAVVNKAKGALTQGWLDELIGFPHISFDVQARELDFNFTAVFTQPGQNVGFYFGGGPLVTNVSAGNQTRFGVASVVNTAFAAYPLGIAPLDPYRSVLFLGTGRSRDFNFVLNYTAPPGQSVRLDFDVLQRPIQVMGQLATGFGNAAVANKAFGIFPASLKPPILGAALVSFPAQARSLNFEFEDSYTPDTGRNIAFAFGLLQGNDAAESPSVALASELAGIGSPTDGYRAIGPSSTLRRHDLIGVVGAGPWATASSLLPA